jgi:predicted phosphoribosyltransferase
MVPRFLDRRHAGRALASHLAEYAWQPGVQVLALPRGGVPVGYEVAERLHAPLDVIIVRKLGVPGHEELAMGAIASGGVLVADEEVIDTFRVPWPRFDQVVRDEARELQRRERELRGSLPAAEVEGRTVILVDDGLATGSTMRAALRTLREQRPARLVVAVPVAAPETCRELAGEVDEMICASTPQPFFAVGQWYADFRQTTDEEVRRLLERARTQRSIEIAASQ